MVNDARVRPDEEVEVGHGTVVQVVELEQNCSMVMSCKRCSDLLWR